MPTQISFERIDGNQYYSCDEPGDQSGTYVLAAEHDRVVAALNRRFVLRETLFQTMRRVAVSNSQACAEFASVLAERDKRVEELEQELLEAKQQRNAELDSAIALQNAVDDYCPASCEGYPDYADRIRLMKLQLDQACERIVDLESALEMREREIERWFGKIAEKLSESYALHGTPVEIAARRAEDACSVLATLCFAMHKMIWDERANAILRSDLQHYRDWYDAVVASLPESGQTVVLWRIQDLRDEAARLRHQLELEVSAREREWNLLMPYFPTDEAGEVDGDLADNLAKILSWYDRACEAATENMNRANAAERELSTLLAKIKGVVDESRKETLGHHPYATGWLDCLAKIEREIVVEQADPSCRCGHRRSAHDENVCRHCQCRHYAPMATHFTPKPFDRAALGTLAWGRYMERHHELHARRVGLSSEEYEAYWRETWEQIAEAVVRAAFGDGREETN